jgi:heavy metal sensor kinase
MAVSLTLFAAGFWFPLRHHLYSTTDEILIERASGVEAFLRDQTASLSAEEIRDEFREHAVLGPEADLFQVSNEDGRWVYRSAPLVKADVPRVTVNELSARGRFSTLEIRGAPLRLFARVADVGGKQYVVQVATSLHEFNEVLESSVTILVALIPGALLLACLGGYWLSRRALRPVDQISRAADEVTAQALSTRLTLPESQDELRRMAETLNRMLDRLEGAFGKIRTFTADAAHELRTPVALIQTTAEVALRHPRNLDEYRQALEQILAETRRTADLVEDLLTMARLDAGSPLTLTCLDLRAVAREALSAVEERFRENAIHVAANVGDRPAPVRGETSALRRIILILLDNACKYTPRGGTVELSVETSNKWAVLAVRDTGIGIAPADIDKVFERFYRADKARSRETGGSGLGLAIAKTLVEAHSGTMSVDSRPGEGSVFTVKIRLQNSE